MQDVVTIVIAALAFVALATGKRGVSAVSRPRDPVASFGFYFIVLGGFIYESRLFPEGALLQLPLIIVTVCAAATVTLREVASAPKTTSRIDIVAVAPAIIGLVFFAVNGPANPTYANVQILGRFISVIAIVSTVFLTAFSRLRLRDFAGIVVNCVLISLILAPFVELSWRACDRFKCGPFGAIFQGIFNSENALAMFISIAILSLLLLEPGRRRVVLLTPLVLALFATESRTAQISLVASLALCAGVHAANSRRSNPGAQVKDLHRISARTPKRNTMWTWLTRVAISATFVAGLYMVYSSDPSDFSNRGGIWQRGSHALGAHWITGLGMDRWTFLQTVGMLPQLFPHSQYLILLFGGGVIAILLMFVLMQRALTPGTSQDGVFAHGFVLYLGIMGITEAYWNPASFDGHSFIVVPLIFLALDRAVVTGSYGPGQGSSYPSYRKLGLQE